MDQVDLLLLFLHMLTVSVIVTCKMCEHGFFFLRGVNVWSIVACATDNLDVWMDGLVTSLLFLCSYNSGVISRFQREEIKL